MREPARIWADNMILKALLSVCAALLLMVGVLWVQGGYKDASIDLLEAEKAVLQRSIATLEESRRQAKQAQEVAEATASRERKISEEFEKIRENLRNGNDEDLPCWFVNDISNILGRLPRKCPE